MDRRRIQRIVAQVDQRCDDVPATSADRVARWRYRERGEGVARSAIDRAAHGATEADDDEAKCGGAAGRQIPVPGGVVEDQVLAGSGAH